MFYDGYKCCPEKYGYVLWVFILTCTYLELGAVLGSCSLALNYQGDDQGMKAIQLTGVVPCTVMCLIWGYAICPVIVHSSRTYRLFMDIVLVLVICLDWSADY